MAKSPAPPADDEDDSTAADAGGDDTATGDDTSDDAGSDEPDVVATIVRAQDGSYVLYAGDEPEEGEDQGAGDQGAGGADMGAQGADEGSQGRTFQSVGALLKGVLELIKTKEADLSGSGSEAQNFQAGYAQSGGPGAKPMAGGGM